MRRFNIDIEKLVDAEYHLIRRAESLRPQEQLFQRGLREEFDHSIEEPAEPRRVRR